MRGWFDLFRDNGGPTLYAYSNRTSVIGDVQVGNLVWLRLNFFSPWYVMLYASDKKSSFWVCASKQPRLTSVKLFSPGHVTLYASDKSQHIEFVHGLVTRDLEDSGLVPPSA